MIVSIPILVVSVNDIFHGTYRYSGNFTDLTVVQKDATKVIQWTIAPKYDMIDLFFSQATTIDSTRDLILTVSAARVASIWKSWLLRLRVCLSWGLIVRCKV